MYFFALGYMTTVIRKYFEEESRPYIYSGLIVKLNTSM
jgi:hypothetical protein